MSAPDPVTEPAAFLSLPATEARQRLLQSLARLAPIQRQIVGRRLCGLTDLDQIAAAVGCEPDAARLLLVQGIAQLRAELSETPQDKNNTAWLKRCQALLIPPARRLTPAPDAMPVPDAPPESATADSQALPEALPGAEAAPGFTVRPVSAPRLGPRLLALAAVVLVAVVAVWAGQHYASKQPVPAPAPAPFDPEIAASPEPVPEAASEDLAEMPHEQAPLTVADLELVLLQQQHPGLLENLDFYLWLVEKDALR